MRAERLSAAAELDPSLMAGGARSRPWVARLAGATGRAAGLELADAVHWLNVLYGRAAGLIDAATLRVHVSVEREFLLQALAGWECERAALARLSVAVGPVPPTPDGATDERAVAQEAEALAVLATSERAGVAWGAAAALIVDWHGLRPLLNRASQRFGAPVAHCSLPTETDTVALIAARAEEATLMRAVAFGARRLLDGHEALVDRLEDRERRRAA